MSDGSAGHPNPTMPVICPGVQVAHVGEYVVPQSRLMPKNPTLWRPLTFPTMGDTGPRMNRVSPSLQSPLWSCFPLAHMTPARLKTLARVAWQDVWRRPGARVSFRSGGSRYRKTDFRSPAPRKSGYFEYGRGGLRKTPPPNLRRTLHESIPRDPPPPLARKGFSLSLCPLVPWSSPFFSVAVYPPCLYL